VLAGEKGDNITRAAEGRSRVTLKHTLIWSPSGFNSSAIQDKVNQQRPPHA